MWDDPTCLCSSCSTETMLPSGEFGGVPQQCLEAWEPRFISWAPETNLIGCASSIPRGVRGPTTALWRISEWKRTWEQLGTGITDYEYGSQIVPMITIDLKIQRMWDSPLVAIATAGIRLGNGDCRGDNFRVVSPCGRTLVTPPTPEDKRGVLQ